MPDASPAVSVAPLAWCPRGAWLIYLQDALHASIRDVHGMRTAATLELGAATPVGGPPVPLAMAVAPGGGALVVSYERGIGLWDCLGLR